MKNLQDSLLQWYYLNGRLELPWRNLPTQSSTPNPRLSHISRSYGVYISEIMLQQTQVSVVMERFYFPFLQTFPTLASLAIAKEEEVLKAWQGLGYYTRARNIQKCAQTCLTHYNATLPSKVEELKKLSGIGEYTAGAIACFGFGECVSFVDGNIARVLSRLFALSTPPLNQLKSLAQEILNPHNPFDHNQALLDIGATICTPKNPNCLFCPFQSFCKGKSAPHLYPLPKKSTIIPLELHLGFYIHNNQISLQKSQERLYHGLYNPIKLNPFEITNAKLIGKFSHSYTKYAISAKVYLLDNKPNEEVEFFTQEQIHSLPISNLCKKALKCLKLN